MQLEHHETASYLGPLVVYDSRSMEIHANPDFEFNQNGNIYPMLLYTGCLLTGLHRDKHCDLGIVESGFNAFPYALLLQFIGRYNFFHCVDCH